MRFVNLGNLRAPSGHRLCRHLRCKEMYYSVAADSLPPEKLDPTHAFEGKLFWCMKTWRSLGPGNEACGAEECPPTRECYEE